jgi:hypothetical protein
MASCSNLKPCLSYPKRFASVRSRSCMTSLKTANERCKRNRRARLAGAAAPGSTGHSSAARSAAAPAAEAAPAAAQTTAHGQVTHDSTRVFHSACANSNAAVTPAHSAEHCERTPVRSPTESARNISSAAASRSHSGTAADDVTGTSGSSSGSSYAPSIADRAPEPGGAAGDGPHAGGASHLAAARCCWPSGHRGMRICAVASAA